ncbi:uncharacterized protein FFMR_08566 [Fusarium fujikuroi]|nr:uncharacterized protein FFM5_05692 [Fusarium fujikuroi]SCO46558.1 uncharacterized protein FFMR_08566 [Fusarium fujikuroi]
MTKGDDAEAQVKVCGETVACGSMEAWKHERSRQRELYIKDQENTGP